MRYIDVCSGISAPTAAWKPLGWQALCYAEIEAAPRAVLAHHYPDVPLVGDFTQIKGNEYGPVDLLVGGTPCQSFSIAGLRGGLADGRGNLALEYLRLADRARPRWLVWENVPGVLSSGGGRDFGAILGGLAELGYGFAYRVLDAQHFGVPQRRRRVFVVGYLGDWRRAAAVLFERHGLSGNPAPRREKGKNAPTIPSRSTGGGGLGTDFDCDGGLIQHVAEIAGTLPAGGNCSGPIEIATAQTAHGTRLDFDSETFIAFNSRENCCTSENVFGSLGSSSPQAAAIAYAIQERAVSENLDAGTQGKGFQADVGYTLEARNKVQSVAYAIGSHAGVADGEVSNASHASGGPVGSNISEELAYSLRSGRNQSVGHASAVRRLTPRECERLQGFPETQNCYIIRIWRDCSEHQKSNAHAALLNLKSQNSASPVGASELTRFANAADEQSNTRLRDLASRAAVSVQIDLERGAVRILSPEKSILSVEGAEDRNLFPLPTGIDSFARLAVLLTRAWEMATRAGRAESQASIRHSIPAWIGSGIAPLSGQEIAAHASDAEKWLSIAKRLSTSTISDAGQITPNFASILETLSCSVAHAIAGCIPPKTSEANFYDIALTTSCGFTAVPYRNRMMADGPRYKMLGNSMAVPVMRWIGERIAKVDAIARGFEVSGYTHGERV